MDLGISGSTALITGSTSGIGFATASMLAQEGVIVVLNGRSQDRVDDAMLRLLDKHPAAQVRSVAADIGTSDGITTVLREVPEVDILVGNAGTFEVTPINTLTAEDWRRSFDVNLLGPATLAQRYLPGMLAAGRGRVVFIGSEAAFEPAPDLLPYSAMKAAILAVASAMAQLTRGTEVTVNTVVPGPTATEGHRTLMSTLAEADGKAELSAVEYEQHFFAANRPTSLLGRFASAAEVASAVTYLCSAHASATNGATVRTDGGAMRLMF